MLDSALHRMIDIRMEVSGTPVHLLQQTRTRSPKIYRVFTDVENVAREFSLRGA